MGKLEMQFQIEGLSIHYKEGASKWRQSNNGIDSEFSIINQQEGRLVIYKENIDPDRSQLEDAWDELERHCKSFQIAMMYLGNHHIERKKIDTFFYHDGKQHTLKEKRNIDTVVKFIRGEVKGYADIVLPMFKMSLTGTVNPIPLPSEMPLIPPECVEWAVTLIQAAELEDYVDMRLKNEFMILEKLLSDKEKDDNDYKHLKHIRNFVSHPVCIDPNVIQFISGELPSAVLPPPENGVKFNRDDPAHIAFVRKYQTKAREWTQRIFEEEVKKQGGSL